MLSSMVLLSLASAPAGLFVRRPHRHLGGWALALIPLTLFALLCTQIPAIIDGASIRETYAWVPQMGLDLAFTLDGLSLLFGLIITGIGTLIVLYTSYYMAEDTGRGRFYLYLLIFMGSMLGLVLAGNVITMFVFWELTSVSSYLLIGFKHDYPEVRRGAQQGLLITVGGGLALLVGLIMLGEAAGSYAFVDILAAGETLQAHPFYVPAVLLIFLGAFTKSAQFPFHFWLPNAMQAPTPASAFLHSATMVKAGVYLLARFYPALSGTPLWTYALTAVGAATLLFGSITALRQYDLKALLAYSTISQLGTLTMLVGLGGKYGYQALVATILAHALYKSALFLVAGIVDHETGTRDLRKLGGLRRSMPATAALAILAALSMAGIPIMFGFVAKEILLKATIESALIDPARYAVIAVVVVSAALGVAYSWRLVRGVFFGSPGSGMKPHVHEAPVGMLLGPGIPATFSLAVSLGLLPLAGEFLTPAATTVAGTAVAVDLRLWYGFTLALGLSAVAIGVGAALTRFERQLVAWPSPLPGWLNSDRIYDATINGLLGGATAFTRATQNGRMRVYMLWMLLAFLALVGPAFTLYGLADLPTPSFANLQTYEALAALLIPVGIIAAIRARSRLGAIIAVGVVGAMMALFFVLFGAPDLALTQLVIEVLSTVFLVLVFAVLPARFEELSRKLTRARDAVIATIIGITMAGVTYAAASNRLFPTIADYFKAESLSAGKGANVVNVILVDFRGLDTMGEIMVLFIALLGIYGMLRLGRARRREADGQPARSYVDVPTGIVQDVAPVNRVEA